MDDKMNDVIDEVQKRLGEEYEVKRVEVMKNNDTKLKGIQVRRKDMNVAKICYWTSESVDEIVAVINRSLFPKFDCEINLEKLKDRIVYTLVNADSNKSRLKTIPYSLYSFSSVKFFLANRAFIIPLLSFKIKYVFLLHYSINIVKTTQKKTAYRKNFLDTVSCFKADIRNQLNALCI